MRHHRVIHSAAIGLAVVALTGPTAAAQPQDLRSPDTADAARSAATDGAPQRNLRFDARTSSLAGTPTARQDLRSPDTRDHAAGRGAFDAPAVIVVKLPRPAPADRAGIDWADAAIGAGTLLGLILLGSPARWRSCTAATTPAGRSRPPVHTGASSIRKRSAMATEPTRPTSWRTSFLALPARVLAALADSTRDWRRGCGL